MSDNTATGGNIWKPQDTTATTPPATNPPITMAQYKKQLVIDVIILAVLVIATFFVQKTWMGLSKPNVVEGNTFTATEVSFIWQMAIAFCYIAVAMVISLSLMTAINENPSHKRNVSLTLIAGIVSAVVLAIGVFTVIAYGPNESKLGTTYTEWLAEDVELEGTEPLIPPSASDALDGDKAVYEGVNGTTVLVERDSSKVISGGPVVYTKEILPAATDSSGE